MSDQSRAHLSRIQAQYQDLTDRFLARWDSAADDVLQQRYTPTRLLSDIFGFWTDVGSGMSLAVDLMRGDFPTVRFLLKTTDKSATQTIALPRTIDVNTPLAPTDVVPVGGVSGPKIPQKQVLPKRADGGDSLLVQLTDLDKVGLVEGDYRGQVLDGNQQTIAYLFVRATN